MAGSSVVAEELGRHGGEPWSRRAKVLLVLAFLALVAVAALVDDRLRRRETAALDQCAERVEADLRAAGRRVWAVAEYARPTVSRMRPGPARDGVFGLVSREAAGMAVTLDPVRLACEDTNVLWLHVELRERREACVGRVAAYQDLFEAIAEDGSRAFSSFDTVTGC